MPSASKDAYLIVVGMDGSEHSLAALGWAIAEARLRGAGIRVVSAWHYPPVASVVGDGVIDDSFKNEADLIVAESLRTVSAAGIPATGQVNESSPAQAILDAAQKAQLIVVGSRGRSGVSSLLLGSVSTHVAHHAQCPVAIVRSALS
ncbi:hypothetical protein BH09ACT6_BH09ACT6_01040 [soil metagenome]